MPSRPRSLTLRVHVDTERPARPRRLGHHLQVSVSQLPSESGPPNAGALRAYLQQVAEFFVQVHGTDDLLEFARGVAMMLRVTLDRGDERRISVGVEDSRARMARVVVIGDDITETVGSAFIGQSGGRGHAASVAA